jgi:hypothetical protein
VIGKLVPEEKFSKKKERVMVLVVENGRFRLAQPIGGRLVGFGQVRHFPLHRQSSGDHRQPQPEPTHVFSGVTSGGTRGSRRNRTRSTRRRLDQNEVPLHLRPPPQTLRRYRVPFPLSGTALISLIQKLSISSTSLWVL